MSSCPGCHPSTARTPISSQARQLVPSTYGVVGLVVVFLFAYWFVQMVAQLGLASSENVASIERRRDADIRVGVGENRQSEPKIVSYGAVE